jgi:hypothetical protein
LVGFFDAVEIGNGLDVMLVYVVFFQQNWADDFLGEIRVVGVQQLLNYSCLVVLDVVHVPILDDGTRRLEPMFAVVAKNIIHGNIPERDVDGLGTAQTNFSGLGSESESTTEVAALFIMSDYLETLFFGELHDYERLFWDSVIYYKKKPSILGRCLVHPIV